MGCTGWLLRWKSRLSRSSSTGCAGIDALSGRVAQRMCDASCPEPLFPRTSHLTCMPSPAQHTRLAKPHHVFAAFVTATRKYWQNEHGYKFKTTPGVKAHVYPLIRDTVIPQGLRIARAQRMGVP
eukprot:3366838-Prymnesium_polylepis.1